MLVLSLSLSLSSSLQTLTLGGIKVVVVAQVVVKHVKCPFPISTLTQGQHVLAESA
jgi:hypothetical protein